ncbi:uncharacterized protein MPTK1_3g11480 [Marchantia polymorpha subsp. ruderalis]|uniref:Serine aminopeptidase S33 domain-containing protein n=2 Tax=Marchantia polymorpha TaxID=3197 RepID=A0AAF6AZQ3_MARPO|nr:hypothetical protein MARPO_0037s0049 [Marchantia polymorpha]BBN05237.1 hypothetical protein Mp_3g11480 [Marchantia polymorpha subsp. ruderalis]|eukprot:PTQ40868.1 hypothetical protein MARPO_0037s0049 [Marchantia polymorpha]
MAHNLQQLCASPLKTVGCRRPAPARLGSSRSSPAADRVFCAVEFRHRSCARGLRSSSANLGDSLCGGSVVGLGFDPLGSRAGFRSGEQIVTSAKMSEASIVPPPGIAKNVTIINQDGEKLVGVIDDTGSKELCVLCHGFRSSKKSTTLGVVASTLVTAGFSSFRFDFSGNGESEGEFAYGNYWKEVEDLRAVIEYWRSQGREITAIIGHSKGGNVVLLYASKYGDVSTVVNVSGRFDLNIGQLERFGEAGMKTLEQEGFLDVKDKAGNVEYRVTLKSLEDRLSTDMDGASKAISKDCRVLTVHGSQDEIVKIENAHDFAKRIPNHTLRVFDGAGHNYEGDRKKLADLVLEFIQGNVSKM